MLCGSLSKRGLNNRGAAVIGRHSTWLRALVNRILAHFGEGSRPRRFRLESFIINDAKFFKAYERQRTQTVMRPRFAPKMCPAAGPPRKWKPLPLRTIGELARWLNVLPNELAWFADCRTLEQKLPPGPLRHYHYRWQSKRDGSSRLIEAPKQRLKAMQRFLLEKILDCIPAHDAAHGFRTGCSIRSFVAPHVKRDVVLRLDLKDFFPGIKRARILAIFLTAGYPESVAEFLTGLCTNSVPSDVMKASQSASNPQPLRRLKLLYQRPHLPQGAPTSPALANLAAYRLDCRLAGLAEAAGAHYTRYADDLVFSGDHEFARMAERFYIKVCAIALEEGFEVHTRKTRVMRQSVSQRAAGVVLNRHINSPRTAYDRLKAIIHNCVAHGPTGQNRTDVGDFRAHLAGRIAHVELLNAARGRKLRQQFDLIRWAQ
jgi:RNA-directed DNA polymerase